MHKRQIPLVIGLTSIPHEAGDHRNPQASYRLGSRIIERAIVDRLRSDRRPPTI